VARRGDRQDTRGGGRRTLHLVGVRAGQQLLGIGLRIRHQRFAPHRPAGRAVLYKLRYPDRR
jgi:hypothetical protein